MTYPVLPPGLAVYRGLAALPVRRVCPARLMASLCRTAFKKRLKCMI